MNYFKLCNKCIYVDQSQMYISTNKLYTSHIGTCSILLFSYKNKNFMAHIDAIQNSSQELIKILKKNFNIEELKKISIYIIPGSWCFKNCFTTTIIKNALKKLNLSFIIYNKKIKWSNDIYIDNNIITIL